MSDETIDNLSSFDFFAAVRLLERLAEANGGPASTPRKGASSKNDRRQSGRPEPVGGDTDPRQEVVRFTAHPSLTFPVGDVHRVDVPAASGQRQSTDPISQLSTLNSQLSAQPRMSVDFLGLVGPNGALPQHYTSLILARLRERDTAFRDFLDLFHHRSVSLYYRAWKKYRLPFQYEGRRTAPDGIDLPTLCLFALTGLGTGGLRGRRTFDDRVHLFFGGKFSRQPRPALELERMLAAQMSVPVRVEQFFGRWLTLGDDELSRLAGGIRRSERYNQLGVNVVIGQRIHDVQSSFRLVLGPMDYRDFRRFTPLGSDLRPLCELTRSFVGPEFEFDVQVILAPRQVPECRLDSTAADGPRLGWNTWLRSGEIDRATTDAVFLLSDV